jgi:hypothetical protein
MIITCSLARIIFLLMLRLTWLWISSIFLNMFEALKYHVTSLGDLYIIITMMMMMITTDLEHSTSMQEESLQYELCLEPLTCVCHSSRLHRSSVSGKKSEFMFTFINNSRGTLDNLLVHNWAKILSSNTCAGYYKVASSLSSHYTLHEDMRGQYMYVIP